MWSNLPTSNRSRNTLAVLDEDGSVNTGIFGQRSLTWNYTNSISNMENCTDERVTEKLLISLWETSDWQSEVAKGNLIPIWKTCSSPEETVANNPVIQSHRSILGDCLWDTKLLGHHWIRSYQGKRIFLFHGGFSWEKNVNPEAVHQHLHEVSALQSYSFEPMPRLEKILKILGWDQAFITKKRWEFWG